MNNGLKVKSHSNSNDWNNEIYLEYPDALFAINSDKDVWKKGDTLLSVSKVFKKPVLKLVLGDDEIPDSNKSDNVFIPKDQP